MKNIKKFENFNFDEYSSDLPIKKYGEPFKLMDLSPGDKITYMGSRYEVIESNEYFVVIKSERDGNTTKLNQSMFNQKVFIGKENVPAKLK